MEKGTSSFGDVVMSFSFMHTHGAAIQCGLTIEGRRDAVFAINEPFVLIEGTVLPNLKSRRHRRGRTRERFVSFRVEA